MSGRQLELFREPKTIRERFERFHGANPHVFALFTRFARDARRRGLKRWSAKAIWERLRWELMVESDEAPKLNNIYTALYARLLMESYPEEFGGFFETRALLSKDDGEG